MNELEFLKGLNDIDDDLLDAANQPPVQKQIPYLWVRMATAAAIVCAVVGLGIFALRSLTPKDTPTDTLVSFALNDVFYDTADLENYMAYRLVNECSGSQSAISLQPLTSKDLGELMGTVEVDGKKVYRVYHYAAYPDSNDICILELGHDNYQIYVKREP